ncbi:RE1-silencing transcription factor-like isoform X2 [Battus philenor]|uniref:RE1-silencing transcription factor-like isoform X2 n=1 Tax=Battus philenor TaxID=42288 RepID=UPI0035D026E4
MEKRRESLSALKVCRFCLAQNVSLDSLYDRRLSSKDTVDLTLKILSCVSIEVFPSDKMPSYICNHCIFFMDLFYKYKQIVRRADENLLKYIQNGTQLESVSWPSLLIKAYQSLNRPEVVKTVVEGGATIQVSTHDSSESDDEEDENVFNVTIAEGSDEGSKGVSTCIKVVTSKDNEDRGKSGLKQDTKGFNSLTKLARHVRSHGGDKPYPCKHCNKSFTKSHHYTRHLRLKHQENNRSCRGPFGQPDQYRCEQCDDSFATQDELIYHSAIHATQNLTCPLCEEKFENVDAVTTHIKSHVNGVEFMCDFCELVFTTKEKLESHLIMAHEDEFNNELGQDESSMEMDPEDDDDDNSINVKDEGDHMVIEIKKADDYMLHSTPGDSEDKCDNTNSEDSEAETVSMMRKDDEVKIKPIVQHIADTEKKVKPNKADSNNSVGASNKSLQLLEKELQELKRTNTRNELNKTLTKSTEPIRGRRPQLHSSTPKIKSFEEKKTALITKMTVADRKTQERRIITKENKEPREIKETKVVNISTKEDKESKDGESTLTPKSVVKNGNNEKNLTDEGIRRSTRPCKIKDYAKMIRDRSLHDEEDSDDVDDDEEYVAEKIPERSKNRKSITKTQPKMIQTTLTSTTQTKTISTPPATPTPRKRGRPRKEPPKEVPAKVKKDTNDENISKKIESEEPSTSKELTVTEQKTEEAKNNSENTPDEPKVTISEQTPSSAGVLVPLLGQTLKKVPVKSLPPGVKPLPLPVTARPLATGELCEMQIGKKMVKVQKIVMTKAEVEAMAKKGLVEMKDGTMVLKQGIKLPTADPVTIKSSLVGETDAGKESSQRKEKGTPSRCDLGEDL